jgi:hypothetical protein
MPKAEILKNVFGKNSLSIELPYFELNAQN